MILFTADTHFNHANIIIYCNRPFSSVEKMNRVLIENWNSIVSDKDVIYHLGDFGFGDCSHIFNQLKGKKILIRGSHDSGSVLRLKWSLITPVLTINAFEKTIFLSHYAHRVWPKSHYGSLHLYGHSHGTLPPYVNSVDVGVDACKYKPITFEEVVKCLFQNQNQMSPKTVS